MKLKIPLYISMIINDTLYSGETSTIMKDVEIREVAVIGACTIVSKNILAHEVWVGKPVCFVRKV
jgi:acetyltransferase-like isoleucine patch superfamily enzyme